LIVNKYLWKCGGTVLSGSVAMEWASIGVAREDDPVLCQIPCHRRTVTAKGPFNV